MVNIEPTEQQPMSDDQELAKVLAGVTGQADGAYVAPTVPQPEPEEPATTDDVVIPEVGLETGDLEEIKQVAIVELRPLVDKLNLGPEEKFDIYLLLLRSTDDKTLVEPAHEAAKAIVDEARRAQALLDIIKEIDFLSNQSAA